MGTKKKKSAKSLAASRPPTVGKSRSISRKSTKSLINTHHQLEKRKRQAAAQGDGAAESAIDKQIAALGGLAKYQEASLQGQRHDRGGDSSGVLMDWLKPSTRALKANPLRLLEVGCLSVDNICSNSGCFEIERIDLHSQGEGIMQQDFLKRPLPRLAGERFDIISLSLVLNYVPHHGDRGDMLLRTLDFLHEPKDVPEACRNLFPSLFLVLPEPCVSNSRYLDEPRLEAIMKSLGYDKVHQKITKRLVYYLWKRVSSRPQTIPRFSKTEVRSGATRNNFAIVLQPG